MGGDLGGTGETVPPKFEVGDGPCIRHPQYFVGCARMHEQSKKGVINEIGVFLVKKGS